MISILKYAAAYFGQLLCIAVHVCQTATYESIITDGCDGAGNDNGGQFAAITENIFPNACHTVGNTYIRKIDAVIVFINCYISAICVLNGRKVMRKNLRIVEKNKI